MNKICLLAIILTVFISCSNSDKFNDSDDMKIRLNRIGYNNSIKTLFADLTYEYNGYPERISLKDLEGFCFYFWVINGDTIYSKNPVLGYGSQDVKFFLLDIYGDIIGDSLPIFCISEPLKITLLSPIDEFEMQLETKPEFQYSISGANCGEYISDTVFVEKIQDTTFWQVMAFTEQDTIFSEPRRLLWKKD